LVANQNQNAKLASARSALIRIGTTFYSKCFGLETRPQPIDRLYFCVV